MIYAQVTVHPNDAFGEIPVLDAQIELGEVGLDITTVEADDLAVL